MRKIEANRYVYIYIYTRYVYKSVCIYIYIKLSKCTATQRFLHSTFDQLTKSKALQVQLLAASCSHSVFRLLS